MLLNSCLNFFNVIERKHILRVRSAKITKRAALLINYSLQNGKRDVATEQCTYYDTLYNINLFFVNNLNLSVILM